MTQSGFEAAFASGARAYYDGLTAADRAEIDEIREAIETNPYPDGQLKRPVDLPNIIVYQDARWAVLYEIAEPGHIQIGDIARAGQPRWWFPR